jgi:hypothetical protein
MVDLTCVQQAYTPSKQQSREECTSLLVNSFFKELPNLNNN